MAPIRLPNSFGLRVWMNSLPLPWKRHTSPSDEKNVENLKAYIQRSKGKRAWFVIESGRYGTLQGMLPEQAKHELRTVDKSNNKFMMLSTVL